jgi:predicted MFS family arabinose efflux permease
MNAAVIGGCLLLIRRTTPGPPPAPVVNSALGSAVRKDITEMLRARSPIWLAVSFAAYAGQFLAIMAFLPMLLTQTAQFSAAESTWIASAVVFSNGFGNVLAGRVLRHWQSIFAAIVQAAAVMALGSLFVFSTDLPVWARLAGVFVFSFGGGAIPAATFARAAAMPLSPSSRAAAIGLLVQGAAIGQFAGPPVLAAVIGEAGAWSNAPLYTTGCAVICALAAYWACRDAPDA